MRLPGRRAGCPAPAYSQSTSQSRHRRRSDWPAAGRCGTTTGRNGAIRRDNCRAVIEQAPRSAGTVACSRTAVPGIGAHGLKRTEVKNLARQAVPCPMQFAQERTQSLQHPGFAHVGRSQCLAIDEAGYEQSFLVVDQFGAQCPARSLGRGRRLRCAGRCPATTETGTSGQNKKPRAHVLQNCDWRAHRRRDQSRRRHDRMVACAAGAATCAWRARRRPAAATGPRPGHVSS